MAPQQVWEVEGKQRRQKEKFLEELNKLSVGDVSADTSFQPKLEVAGSEGKVCLLCREVFWSRNRLFYHLWFEHKYVRCWHCMRTFASDKERHGHLMYLPTEEEEAERERKASCQGRDLLRDIERGYCPEQFLRIFGLLLRPTVLSCPMSNKGHASFGQIEGCCYYRFNSDQFWDRWCTNWYER